MAYLKVDRLQKKLRAPDPACGIEIIARGRVGMALSSLSLSDLMFGQSGGGEVTQENGQLCLPRPPATHPPALHASCLRRATPSIRVGLWAVEAADQHHITSVHIERGRGRGGRPGRQAAATGEVEERSSHLMGGVEWYHVACPQRPSSIHANHHH